MTGEFLSPRQRQTQRAREAFAARILADPERRSEHYRRAAEASRGRLILSRREAEALRQAIVTGDPGDAAAWRSLLAKLVPSLPTGGAA